MGATLRAPITSSSQMSGWVGAMSDTDVEMDVKADFKIKKLVTFHLFAQKPHMDGFPPNFVPFLSNSSTGHTAHHIFTLNGSNDADSRKCVPFLALVDIAAHLGDQISGKKTIFWRG